MFLKSEEQFEVVFDDCGFESAQADVVDLTFAYGCGYLNLRGIGRPEKSVKVDRY